ncbi:MAG: hypothetical protein Q8N26_04740 [Myxococcales bacterium]|nr:hypothetical protein [Myxococcales bacterium]
MSEFSSSLHLHDASLDAVVELLRRAKVAGFVFPPEHGWIAFTALDPARVIAANEGRLVHYDFSSDHELLVEAFDGQKRLARMKVDFEQPRARFEAPKFVAHGLMTRAGVRKVEQWLETGGSRGAAVVAKALGLTRFRWLSHAYELANDDPAVGRVEVDKRGAVRAAGPDEALEPPLTAAMPRGTTNADFADELQALADVSKTLSERKKRR